MPITVMLCTLYDSNIGFYLCRYLYQTIRTLQMPKFRIWEDRVQAFLEDGAPDARRLTDQLWDTAS